jgi:amyloid beta precursor protein binding protein 1
MLKVHPQNETSSGFWIIADAVEQFYNKHKCLPLPGNVPDMKAQSKIYVQLQNIYKTKARQDAAEVLQTVQATEDGRDVDPAEVELFCKNAAFVKLINATKGDSSIVGSSDNRLKAVVGKSQSLPLASPVLSPSSGAFPARRQPRLFLL